jgi:hypothetical protein
MTMNTSNPDVPHNDTNKSPEAGRSEESNVESIYVPLSERTAAMFEQAAGILAIDGPTLQALFLVDWIRTLRSKNFCELISSGSLKAEQVVKGLDRPDIELYKKTVADESENALSNARDRRSFELKKMIKIGDEIVAEETRTFLSGGEYITKGGRYPIISIDDQGYGDFTVRHKTNLPAPDDQTITNNCGIYFLYRAGKEIWSWHEAWKKDWEADHGALTPEDAREDAQMVNSRRDELGIFDTGMTIKNSYDLPSHWSTLSDSDVLARSGVTGRIFELFSAEWSVNSQTSDSPIGFSANDCSADLEVNVIKGSINSIDVRLRYPVDSALEPSVCNVDLETGKLSGLTDQTLDPSAFALIKALAARALPKQTGSSS